MAKKVLLASLSTTREGVKVRFAANQVADLNKDEINLLDRMTTATGRPHYRAPVNEAVDAKEPADRADEDDDEYLDRSVAMDSKNVAALQAYLDHNSVAYDADDKKADLLKRAKAHESDGGL